MTQAGADRLDSRRSTLRRFGATDDQMDGLLAYAATAYAGIDAATALPLADEPHIAAWETYAADAAAIGAFAALQKRFVQLQFPIRAGMSEQDDYRRATRRGDFTAAADHAPGLKLEGPDELDLQLHRSAAGTIPVLVPATRRDFISFVQAFTERNEPVPVPDSMGACMVNGLNNWDRVSTYRQQWTALHGESADWGAEFKVFATKKPLYQDRFIILSRGPYSAVGAEEIGRAAQAWTEQSIAIRREHECLHYLTYRLSGLIRSNALDELVADFAGLVAATGTYSADLAIRFLGLHRAPEIPADSRLQVYRGELSDMQLRIVASLARAAAQQLELCAGRWGNRLADVNVLASVILALLTVNLEELAEGAVPLPAGR